MSFRKGWSHGGPIRAPRNMAAGNDERKKKMFNIHKESFEWGGRTLTLETGKVARQADGAVLATYGETVVLATVVGAAAPRGRGFLPAHRQLPGTLLRRRQDSGRLFQARARPDRARDPDLAPDRPPDPSAVRRRLSQRDAGRGAGSVPRPGERSRCRRPGRRPPRRSRSPAFPSWARSARRASAISTANTS